MNASLRRGSSGRGAALAAALLGAAALALVAINSGIRDNWWLLAVALLLAALVETATEANAARVRARAASQSPVSERPSAERPAAASASQPPPVPQKPLPATVAPNARVVTRAVVSRPPRRRPPGLSGEGFVLPKSTARQGECDDSWCLDLASGRFAVSDGASSAFMSAQWSQVLTSSYVAGPPEHDLTAVRRWVAECSEHWAAHLGELPQPAQGGDWWNEASARRGSFATFLGIRVGSDEVTGTVCWDALAIGDSCLVQVRPSDTGIDQLVCAFPLETSHAFGGSPELVPTVGAEGASPVDLVRTATGSLRPGDSLLVMTDALAQWALAEHERGASPWTHLVEISNDGLAELVHSARTASSMVDDDVTLVRIGFEAPAADATVEVDRASATPLAGQGQERL